MCRRGRTTHDSAVDVGKESNTFAYLDRESFRLHEPASEWRQLVVLRAGVSRLNPIQCSRYDRTVAAATTTPWNRRARFLRNQGLENAHRLEGGSTPSCAARCILQVIAG